MSGTGLVNVNSAKGLTLSGALSNGGAGTLALTQSGTGTTILTGANTYSGATTVSAGTLQIGDGSTTGDQFPRQHRGHRHRLGQPGPGPANGQNFSNAVALNSATTALKALNSTGTTLKLSGVISGAGAFNQNGTGTTVLAGGVTETYTGATNINAGTLEVDGTLATGSTVHVASGATLTGNGTIKGNATLTGTGDHRLGTSGNIGGTLAVTGGHWSLDGTVTGAITSSSGTFSIASGADLTAKAGLNVTERTLAGTGEVDGKLTDTSTTSFTFGGVIGDGTVPKSGAVVMNKASTTLTLTGANTYTGGTTVTAGTLQLGDGTTTGATLGSGVVSLASGATLAVNLANGETFSNPITNSGHVAASSNNTNTFIIASIVSGAGNFLKSGTNTATLTGNNTYTGGTTVSGGTLVVNNAAGSGTGTGAVAVNSGGTLGGSGKVSGATTLNTGGTIAPGAANASANTTLHGSSLLWNGNSTISLQLGAASGDQLNLTGALTKGTTGAFTIDLLNAGITTQTSYTLLTFASTTFSLSNFTLELPTVNFTGTLVENSTSLSITNLQDPPPNSEFEAAEDGTLNLGVERRRQRGFDGRFPTRWPLHFQYQRASGPRRPHAGARGDNAVVPRSWHPPRLASSSPR